MTKYKEEYNLTYHLSDGYSIADIKDGTKENWYAFALCVMTEYEVDESLKVFNLRNVKSKALHGKYLQYVNIAYILNSVCGVTKADTSRLLKVSLETIRSAIKVAKGEKRK